MEAMFNSSDPFGYLLGVVIIVALLFMPAWFLVAVPFWKGFLQTFHLTHPVDDAVREATGRVAGVLEELRDASRDVLGRVTKTVAKEAENWVLRSLEPLRLRWALLRNQPSLTMLPSLPPRACRFTAIGPRTSNHGWELGPAFRRRNGSMSSAI